MSKNPPKRVALSHDLVTGLPFAGEVEDFSTWPSISVAHQAFSTVIEIHNQGYEGIRLRSDELSTGEFLFTKQVDTSSPEGKLIEFVMSLAQHGFELDTKVTMALLRHIYQTAGLPKPTPANNRYSFTPEEDIKS
jgi:hypothetical protein